MCFASSFREVFLIELTFDEWMELDLQYIRDRSFWVDWKLIFQTVGVVFRMYGV